MDFVLNNLIPISFVTLVLCAIIVRYSIRSYFAEKRRHLSIMMHGDVDVTDHTSSEIAWKDKLKEK